MSFFSPVLPRVISVMRDITICLWKTSLQPRTVFKNLYLRRNLCRFISKLLFLWWRHTLPLFGCDTLGYIKETKLNCDVEACGLQRKLPLWHQIKFLLLYRTNRLILYIHDDQCLTNQWERFLTWAACQKYPLIYFINVKKKKKRYIKVRIIPWDQ